MACISFWVKLERSLAAVMLALIVLCVFFAALMRTAGFPVIWSVDIAQLLFVWVCVIGGNQAMRDGDHVGVDYFVKRLPLKLQLSIDVVVYILMAAFLTVLIVYGLKLTLLNPERELGAAQLPYSLVTIAIPFGGGLMLCTVVAQGIYLVRVCIGNLVPDYSLPFMQKFVGDNDNMSAVKAPV